MPIRNPPSMAPAKLPMPPSTAAVKALRPAAKPLKTRWTVVDARDETRRAGKQSGDQKRYRDRAVDVDAHERCGFPVLGDRAHRATRRVRSTYVCSAKHRDDRQSHDEDLLGATVKAPTWNVGLGKTAGNGIGDEPCQACIAFSRMNEKPIAVISGASRGALRRRRYASRSSSMPTKPQHTAAIKAPSRHRSRGPDRAARRRRPAPRRPPSEKNVPSV